MFQQWLDQIAREAAPRPIDIVRDILDQVESLPRLMEVHYLVQEPALLEIMRGLGSLSDADRDRLRKYLARHGKERLGVRVSLTGALILELADKVALEERA
jgi:hypothetical protein